MDINKLTLEMLEGCYKEAIQNDLLYVAVKIQMQGFEEPEVIINRKENYETKLAYYKKAYNEDLTLKAFNGIKIIECCNGDSYKTIEEQLRQTNTTIPNK